MKEYTVYLDTESEKYDLIRAIRAAGARLLDVSGCAPGYLVTLAATEEQRLLLGRVWYSPEIHSLSAQEAWNAWKGQRLTVGQLATWQERHGCTFDQEGGVAECSSSFWAASL